MDGLLAWFANPAHWAGADGIPERLLQHLEICATAVLVALVIGLTLGLYVGHTGRGATAAINVANIGRAIPSYALLGMVLPVSLAFSPDLGLYVIPTFVAMTALAIPPILVGAFSGIRAVDRDLVEAARGMGLRERQVLLGVEIPLAAPVIVGGIRTATLQVIATATIGAIVGGPGLGRYIFDGLLVTDVPQVVAGAILVAGLAIVIDLILAATQRLLTPRPLRPGASDIDAQEGREKHMRERVLAIGAVLALVLGACSSGSASLPTVRIGSDNFYESKLMAEIYAQVLEHAGYTVDRHLGLGTRPARQPLLEQGQVDLVPEYVGSGLGYYDKTQETGDGEKNRAALAAILKSKGGGIEVFGITPAQDTNAFVVRPDTASSLNLKSMSDLAAAQDQLKWGLPPECGTNPLCSGALQAYGVTFPPKQLTSLAACDAPIAEALKAKTIDIAELCSTQPAIAQFGFITLADDKHTQPAENIAPLVRDDFLAKVPDRTAFQKLLDDASAKMDTATLTALGVRIGVNNEDIAAVAKDWLTKNGLL